MDRTVFERQTEDVEAKRKAVGWNPFARMREESHASTYKKRLIPTKVNRRGPGSPIRVARTPIRVARVLVQARPPVPAGRGRPGRRPSYRRQAPARAGTRRSGRRRRPRAVSCRRLRKIHLPEVAEVAS
ncbi:hypothetical protein GCM10009654_49970 [Streptomyces hebeiensis]|uniref:Uncharacterized protein n=1 Tax=Streptomyces hebeiensis TaxID=229486 RepID=A0ABP4FMM9_9ACTN